MSRFVVQSSYERLQELLITISPLFLCLRASVDLFLVDKNVYRISTDLERVFECITNIEFRHKGTIYFHNNKIDQLIITGDQRYLNRSLVLTLGSPPYMYLVPISSVKGARFG